MDILGKQVSEKVIQKKGHQLRTFDVDGLQAGIYILRGEPDGHIILMKINVN